MNLDLSISDIIVGVLSFLAVVVTVRQNKKIAETHKVTTVNHHSSDTPTIPDRLDNIEKGQQLLFEMFNRHLKEHDK